MPTKLKKTLDQQIEAFKDKFEELSYHTKYARDEQGIIQVIKTPYHAWHWDENWDGKLVQQLYALQAMGFRISTFNRNGTIRITDPTKARRDLQMTLIYQAIGNEFHSIAFPGNGGIIIRWKSVKRWW